MIIIKLAYKILGGSTFVDLPVRMYSTSLNENVQSTPNGTLSSSELTSYIPVISPEQTELLKQLAGSPAIYQATDAFQNIHLLGNDLEPASLSFTKRIEKNPGIAHGYDIKISCNTTR